MINSNKSNCNTIYINIPKTFKFSNYCKMAAKFTNGIFVHNTPLHTTTMRPIKEYFETSNKNVFHLDYSLRKRWRIKSKYHNFFLLLLPLSYFISFNLLNYHYSSVFHYTFPPVDVVNTLVTFNNIPNYSYDHVYDRKFWFDNSAFLGTLKSIYLINEDTYIESNGECTISVEPRIVWSPYSISLNLKEGMFNFSSGVLQLNETTISHSITKEISPKGNHFDLKRPSKLDEAVQNFIRQYIYTAFYSASIPPSFYNIDTLIYPFFIARIANLGILILSILIIVCMTLVEIPQPTKFQGPAHIANFVTCFLSLISALVFLGIKLSISIIVGSKFPSARNHLVGFISSIQIVVIFGLCIINYRKFTDKLAGIKEEASIKKLLSGFEPSIQQLPATSSIYSDKETPIEVAKRDISAISLDPMKREAVSQVQLVEIHVENCLSGEEDKEKKTELISPYENPTAYSKTEHQSAPVFQEESSS